MGARDRLRVAGPGDPAPRDRRRAATSSTASRASSTRPTCAVSLATARSWRGAIICSRAGWSEPRSAARSPRGTSSSPGSASSWWPDAAARWRRSRRRPRALYPDTGRIGRRDACDTAGASPAEATEADVPGRARRRASPRRCGGARRWSGRIATISLIEVDERDLRLYGSRGQQRLMALALRLAEAGPVARAVGSAPVLLLDDALSELDPQVQARVLEHVARRGPGLPDHRRRRAAGDGGG